MRVKDLVGRFGEDVAAEHVRGAGMEILARNWRCSEGELDIVARDRSELVFIEVKTRSSSAFGSPAEALHRRKIARLRRLAVRWLDAHPGERSWQAVRFDVVSIVRCRAGGLDLQHLRGAF